MMLMSWSVRDVYPLHYSLLYMDAINITYHSPYCDVGMQGCNLNLISCILYIHLGTMVIQNPGNNEVGHNYVFCQKVQ